YTNYNESDIGIKTIKLLTTLGYSVVIPKHLESARTYISKGLIRDAQKIARKNIDLLKDLITDETPLLGIEPSAILGFRDEYLKLVEEDKKPIAEKLAKNCFLIDEFLAAEIDKGNIAKDAFTSESRVVKLHGHCHQKALSSLTH